VSEFFTKKEWVSVVENQESVLTFDSFDNEDGLVIGEKIIRLAKEEYKQPVAISIEIDNDIVFSYLMPGTSIINKQWMFRKSNVSKKTLVSSIHTCLDIAYANIRPKWLARQELHAACGGCWQVTVKGEPICAYIMVSGLEHYLDHQIMVDAISEHLGLSVEPLKR